MKSDPGIVTVRPFEAQQDLEAAADLGDRVRKEDPSVEPFAQRLALLATSPRARLELWQVAAGEDGRLHGLVFAAVREERTPERPSAPSPGAVPAGAQASKGPRPGYTARPDLSALLGELPGARPHAKALHDRDAADPVAPAPLPAPHPAPHPAHAPGSPGPRVPARTTVELYATVSPALRRQGLGRALVEPALEWLAGSPTPASLRTRVRDLPEAQAGQKFLKSLGFSQTSAQLQLAWSPARPLDERPLPGLVLAPLARSDPRAAAAFAKLQNDAWAGAPDTFATRADELAQLLSELGRLVLVAHVEGKPVGYLSGVFLGRTLGLEEVAVLPELRRMGLGRALVVQALVRESPRSAVLSVSEDNRAARALYKSLGFTQTARRLVLERLGGPPPIAPVGPASQGIEGA